MAREVAVHAPCRSPEFPHDSFPLPTPMTSVSLLFGVHAHQPAGNFPEVLDEAHAAATARSSHTVHRYPEFRFAVHFSGWLLEYLLEHYPEDMALLREMVARAARSSCSAAATWNRCWRRFPRATASASSTRCRDRLEQAFGQRPHGAWLTERVWEATVVPVAGRCRHRVRHRRRLPLPVRRQRPATSCSGYFSTEEDGRASTCSRSPSSCATACPSRRRTRRSRYIESLAGDDEAAAAAIYFDDIEKFGIWPETYDWVYEKGWLEALHRRRARLAGDPAAALPRLPSRQSARGAWSTCRPPPTSR